MWNRQILNRMEILKEAAMDKVWYYMKSDRQKFGPFSDDELVGLIRNGILEGKDFIWMPDLEGWLRIEDTIYSVFIAEEERTEE